MDSSSFDALNSVDAFLKAARSSKSSQLDAINKELAPMIQSPSTYAIPPDLAESINALAEQYGDEAWKQIMMFCLGHWLETHEEVINETDDPDIALWTMADLSTLRHCLSMVDGISAFKGTDQWKEMIQEQVGQAVLEACEEQNIKPDEWFSRFAEQ